MATERQRLGNRGEAEVAKRARCPSCGHKRHLVKLRQNFQCADLICKFCGHLAQVKAYRLDSRDPVRPAQIMGAAWGPQHEQILAGIYHDLYLVGFSGHRLARIERVPAHVLQATPKVFSPRNPLKPTAKRAGWRGFNYRIDEIPEIGIEEVFSSAT